MNDLTIYPWHSWVSRVKMPFKLLVIPIFSVLTVLDVIISLLFILFLILADNEFRGDLGLSTNNNRLKVFLGTLRVIGIFILLPLVILFVTTFYLPYFMFMYDRGSLGSRRPNDSYIAGYNEVILHKRFIKQKIRKHNFN